MLFLELLGKTPLHESGRQLGFRVRPRSSKHVVTVSVDVRRLLPLFQRSAHMGDDPGEEISSRISPQGEES